MTSTPTSMSNSNKIILDLCGGTGAWSRPYKEAGYEVINVTLPEYDVTMVQFVAGSIEFHSPEGKLVTDVLVNDVYGILAAPECTQFSIARTTARTPRSLRKGMVLVEACLDIIWEVRKQHKLAFWVLENPRGLLRQFLGKPTLSFQPNEFGDLHTKHTDLWGYFKEPKRHPVKIPNRIHMQLAKNNRILPKLPEGYKPPYGRNTGARRAITPSGFANAFFKANQ